VQLPPLNAHRQTEDIP